MNRKKATADYLANQVYSASPNKLIELLLEAAVKKTKLAELALMKSNLPETHQLLVKAQAIVLELQQTLNYDIGGEIAEQLGELYEFIYQRLVDANIEKKVNGIKDAQKLLEDLLTTWREITIN
ncbi:flagellar export chaperone FliS [Enterococcus italicus]|jgi:flagellar protein FliS|uniref:flagellar export chaperone FliS n=1 Tax=Enterococcus italicus TaxID=246144 RepID=UPI0028A96604|nr:flagellar export chaperone FliS [Enterococcus italicus]